MEEREEVEKVGGGVDGEDVKEEEEKEVEEKKEALSPDLKKGRKNTL